MDKPPFAKANERKSGDLVAGIATRSERERVAAKRVLADLTLAEIVAGPMLDPVEDDVSRLILDTQDRSAFAGISGLVVSEFREVRPGDNPQPSSIHRAVTPEVAAATRSCTSRRGRAERYRPGLMPGSTS